MSTLCLNMIVKNEEAVIERALSSVLDIIDYWCIVDTGSTDRTKEIILEVLGDIPGELVESEWVNFGHNRTESVELANGKADYILLMDADMTAVYKDPSLSYSLYRRTRLRSKNANKERSRLALHWSHSRVYTCNRSTYNRAL